MQKINMGNSKLNFLLSVAILIFYLYGCSNKTQPKKSKYTQEQLRMIDSLRVEIDSDIENYAIALNNISYKDTVFKELMIILKKSIKNNKVPDFFYNECLDNEYCEYYKGNTHKKFSLRTDLINQLDSSEVRILLTNADTIKLRNLCTEKKEFMVNNRLTTKDLLESKLKSLKENKK